MLAPEQQLKKDILTEHIISEQALSKYRPWYVVSDSSRNERADWSPIKAGLMWRKDLLQSTHQTAILLNIH